MTPEEKFERDGQEHYTAERYDKALECIHALYELGRNEPALHLYEAECLYYLRRAPEAIEIMRALTKEHPSDTTYALLLSQYLRAVGNFEESYQLIKNIPGDTPGYATFMGWRHLRLGDFLGGYRTFQKEKGIHQLDDKLGLPKEKRLQKNISLRGKKVFFPLEGGFGDEIAYARFPQYLEALGAQVITGASNALVEVLTQAPSLADVREIGSVQPHEYDYYIAAINMADMFEITDPKDNCAFPYLAADPEEMARWKDILENEASGKIKMGIHWQGNWLFEAKEFKSIPAKLMLRFAECGKLFSLQHDARNNSLPLNSGVFELIEEPLSWKSTAAAMANMDWIITNDSSIAHMAGALGKKTLAILPHAPSLYWLPLEDKSFWYPNIRQFRQPKYNDWEGAVEAAYQYLCKNISL